jgi:hypothetical protein
MKVEDYMPESNSSENTGNVFPYNRSKFQFSIRSLLLFVLTVALALTSVLMYRRMSEAERELVKLRSLTGYFKIEDPTLFQSLALECEEPLTWKWRVFLPKGSQYSWHLNYGDLPEIGTSIGSGVSSLESMPRSEGVEAIVTVSLQKDPEPDKNRWGFSLSCREIDSGARKNITGSVPDEVMEKIFQCPMKTTQTLGLLKPETRKPDESIIFLKYRIGEQSSPGSWSSITKNPQPGIVVWIEKAK